MHFWSLKLSVLFKSLGVELNNVLSQKEKKPKPKKKNISEKSLTVIKIVDNFESDS